MVLEATRMASTCERPYPLRWTARTILLTSTGSSAPLRLRTCMTGVSSRTGKPGVMSARVVWTLVLTEAAMDESPWPQKRAKKQRDVFAGDERQDVATSPPLGGA